MATAPVLPVEEPGEVEYLSPLDKTGRLAGSQGNIVDILDEDERTKLGNTCVDEYDKDMKDREEWATVVEESLDSAAQDKAVEAKTTPWPNASNINVPLLTTAALQFNARMYPAVVKGDEAVLCKVVGQDNGRPEDGAQPADRPDDADAAASARAAGSCHRPAGPPQPVMGPDGQMVPEWEVPPGAKSKRARRVSEYLNTCHLLPHGRLGGRHRRAADAVADRRLRVPQGVVRQVPLGPVDDGAGAGSGRAQEHPRPRHHAAHHREAQ